jgi:hypothetical protein
MGKMGFRFGAVALLGLVSGQAHAYTQCTSENECQFNLMPLVNQNDPAIGTTWLPDGPSESQLCGPAAGVMALTAILIEGTSVVETPSTTVQTIYGQTNPERIRRMATLMGTSPTGGTPLWGVQAGGSNTPIGVKRGVHDRSVDFDDGTAGGMTVGCQPRVSATALRDLLQGRRSPIAGGCTLAAGTSSSQSGWTMTSTTATWEATDPDYTTSIPFFGSTTGYKAATVLAIGTYKARYVTGMGKTYIQFDRINGHFVTVRGHFYHWLEIFDPWYAARSWRVLRKMEGGWRSADLNIALPGGAPWIGVLEYVSNSATSHPAYPPAGATPAVPTNIGIPAHGSQWIMVDGVTSLWLD